MSLQQGEAENTNSPNPYPPLSALPQPLDKMEREEVRKEALKYVDKGFQLVAKEKVRGGEGGREAP